MLENPTHWDTRAQRAAALVLDLSRRQGADAAQVSIGIEQGLSVDVRMGQVETVEQRRQKSLRVTVYVDRRCGNASSTDLGEPAIRAAVEAAVTIARHTAPDPYAGLADPQRLARALPDLGLYHPWALDVPAAVDLARQCEDAARGYDARISNSEGGRVSSRERLFLYANSAGFMGTVLSTRHGLGCTVITGTGVGMQRDGWSTVARDPAALEAAEQVGEKAAQRSLRRLGARRLTTCVAPVVFEAPLARRLVGHFVAAIRGHSLYRDASFLCGCLGQTVMSGGLSLLERPHLVGAMGSAAFDLEGVATQDKDVVVAGVLRAYLLDSYAARRLGMETTGNAGGAHNLIVRHVHERDAAELVADMDRGLLVTDVMGFGVNTVTGDYSRGAFGFWIENGTIQYPVEGITIAGNLKEMLRHIDAAGNDVDTRGNIRTGSLRVARMTLAGG